MIVILRDLCKPALFEVYAYLSPANGGAACKNYHFSKVSFRLKTFRVSTAATVDCQEKTSSNIYCLNKNARIVS